MRGWRDDWDIRELVGDAPAWAVPPRRFAVPASACGVLAAGQLVTVAQEGAWLVDELIVTHGPGVGRAGETYDVAPLAEWGAASIRRDEQTDVPRDGCARLLSWAMPTDALWVYRDGPERAMVDDLGTPGEYAWMSRLAAKLDEPPSRDPRPARELPSLTGRRLRARAATGSREPWAWVAAVSEVFDRDGAFLVRTLRPSEYWRLA